MKEYQKQQVFFTNADDAIAILLYEFATGTGEPERYFANDKVSEAMINSLSVKSALDAYYEKNKNNNRLENLSNWGYGLAPSPIYNVKELPRFIYRQTDPFIKNNSVELFLGSSVFDISQYNEDILKITISNKTGRNSFNLHMDDDYTRDDFGGNYPLSNIIQHIEILLPIRFEKLNRYKKQLIFKQAR